MALLFKNQDELGIPVHFWHSHALGENPADGRRGIVTKWLPAAGVCARAVSDRQHNGRTEMSPTPIRRPVPLLPVISNKAPLFQKHQRTWDGNWPE